MSAFPSPPDFPTDFPATFTIEIPPPPPPLRVLGEDGTLHFSDLKKIALSGRQYLHAINTPTEPTSRMLLGTCVHLLVLGPRTGAKPLVRFPGKTRRGKEWDVFKAANRDAEIVTDSEWKLAEQIAEAVMADPVARARFEDARFEVPLEWEEAGFKCSTSGLDIATAAAAIGDLKTTPSTFPDEFQRHAFKMLYPQQLAFYLRGARANGIDVSAGAFVLGVETKAPFEVVDLELTENMLSFADRSISLWLERLRGCLLACPEPRRVSDWPGYAQAPVAWDVPRWADDSDDEEEDDDEEDGSV